jgi:hypothetical protein
MSVYSATVYVTTNVGAEIAAYDSILDAADDAGNATWGLAPTAYWGSTTGDSTMGVGSELQTSTALSAVWSSSLARQDGNEDTLYINKGQSSVKTISGTSVVTATVSSTPAATHTVTHTAGYNATGTGGIVSVSATGADATVGRNFEIAYGTTTGSISNTATVSLTAGGDDEDLATQTLSTGVTGASPSGQLYYAQVRVKNADKDGAYVQSTNNGATATTVYLPVTIISKHTSNTSTGAASNDNASSNLHLAGSTTYNLGTAILATNEWLDTGAAINYSYRYFDVYGGRGTSDTVTIRLDNGTNGNYSDVSYKHALFSGTTYYKYVHTDQGFPSTWQTGTNTVTLAANADNHIFFQFRFTTPAQGEDDESNTMYLKCRWSAYPAVEEIYTITARVPGTGGNGA